MIPDQLSVLFFWLNLWTWQDCFIIWWLHPWRSNYCSSSSQQLEPQVLPTPTRHAQCITGTGWCRWCLSRPLIIISATWRRRVVQSWPAAISVLKSNGPALAMVNSCIVFANKDSFEQSICKKDLASRRQSMMAMGKGWFGFRSFKKCWRAFATRAKAHCLDQNWQSLASKIKFEILL